MEGLSIRVFTVALVLFVSIVVCIDVPASKLVDTLDPSIGRPVAVPANVIVSMPVIVCLMPTAKIHSRVF